MFYVLAGDATLDTSKENYQKPHSPTSSVTSQRKLEWDSLADVGYANESDRKTASSNLSTLERLALLQQYTNSDNKQNSSLGQPSAHSTLLDIKKDPSKKTNKKNLVKRTREIHQKDIDTVELHLPHSSENVPISVNLSKRISFNVEKYGGVTMEKNEREPTINPVQKVSVETIISPETRFDKEMQTSFAKSVTDTSESNEKKRIQDAPESGPVIISLNTIRRRIKGRKKRSARKKPISKKQTKTKIQDKHQNKSVDQVSEAESFEYMPGHIYNQNKIITGPLKTRNSAGNKSSLESSGGITTESSKSSSFTKDLEKSIKLLNEVLQRHNDDSHLKKQLVKEVVRKLVNTNYRDDESATEFLSGLSYSSKRLDLSKANQNYTTTSTSDNNNSGDTAQRPRKSILRMDKFDSKALASNSQSAPNLPTVSNSDVPTVPNLAPSNLESDASVDKSFIKASSEEIYHKYLEALRKEDAYRKQLKEKGRFLKQKLVGSESALRLSDVQVPVAKPNKLGDLIKDLIRNNYDDGSGDASKLEGGRSSNSRNFTSNSDIRKPRSHSVFTLSSGNSDGKCLDKESRKMNLRKRLQNEIQASSSSNEGTSKAAMRREHFCCCPYHSARCGFTDSSTQVNIEHCQNCDQQKQCPCKMFKDIGDMKMYPSSKRPTSPRKLNIQYSINKGSDLDTHKDILSKKTFNADYCSGSKKTSEYNSPRFFSNKNEETEPCASQNVEFINKHPHKADRMNDQVIFEKRDDVAKKLSQSSQTNVAINIFTKKLEKFCNCTNPMCERKCRLEKSFTSTNLAKTVDGGSNMVKIYETTRCVQTEISIDPKISDPQLPDIVIVNSKDLVQIISEHYREVSISKLSVSNDVEVKYLNNFKNSETQFGTDTDEFTYLAPQLTVDDKSLTCCKTQIIKPYLKHHAASQSTFNPFKQLDLHLPSEFKINTDSYAIPLEGTNMTLRVSIGTKDGNTQNVEQHGKLANPCPVDSSREGRSSHVKCQTEQQTKIDKILEHSTPEYGPPSTKTKADDMFYGLSDKSSFEGSMPNEGCENNKKSTERLPIKYPTYPSTQQKQFLRTNTDTALLDNKAVGGSVVESVIKSGKKIRDIDTQAYIPTEEKSIETHKSNSVLKPISDSTNCSRNSKPVQKAATSTNCFDKTVEESVAATHPRQIANSQPQIQNSTKLLEARKVAEEKQNTGCVQQLQRSTHMSSNSCETDVEDTAEKSLDDNTKCQCRNSAVDEKLGEATSVVLSQSEKSSEEASCINCSKPLKQSPGFGNSCVCLNIKPDEPRAKLRGVNLEAVSSLPTSGRSTCSDPVMDKIKEITKHYGKKDLDKSKKKKCFKEIISVLNYLLETEDKPEFVNKECVEPPSSNETSEVSPCCSKAVQNVNKPIDNLTSKCTKESSTACSPKKFIDRAIQLTQRKSRIKPSSSDSSDIPTSSDIPECASDAATCKILNKIKKECEKYYQKRCKSFHHNVKCESSGSSAQCEDCKKAYHCACRLTKCKSKTVSPTFRLKKKCYAYNLIIRTSDSVVSDAQEVEEKKQELEEVVVKVPPNSQKPLPEYQSYLPHKYERAQTKTRRPKSASEPLSATDDYKKAHGLTVKEYLHKNRPDFIESSTHRANYLKMMAEHR